MSAKMSAALEHAKEITALTERRRRYDELYDEMRRALRYAAFDIDSTRLIMTDPETRKLAKELADEYRELADQADAVADDHNAQGEECSERR